MKNDATVETMLERAVKWDRNAEILLRLRRRDPATLKAHADAIAAMRANQNGDSK